jgi:hypothetical protein
MRRYPASHRHAVENQRERSVKKALARFAQRPEGHERAAMIPLTTKYLSVSTTAGQRKNGTMRLFSLANRCDFP